MFRKEKHTIYSISFQFMLFHISLFHIGYIFVKKKMHGLVQFRSGLPNGIYFSEIECAKVGCVKESLEVSKLANTKKVEENRDKLEGE